MKKWMVGLFLMILLLTVTGCGSAEQETSEAGMVDLTELSSTMVYSEVYEMMTNSEKYEGRTVKMAGRFSVYQGEDGEKYYPACIVQDATACCSQGIEFLLKGDKKYPDDYPELGTEIVVKGTFESYSEGEDEYVHLVDAEIE